MRLHFLLSVGLLWLISHTATAQDKNFATRIISDLSSPEFFGRGYYNNGVNKAADYLVKQLQLLEIAPLSNSYKQEFFVDVNTFPNKILCVIENDTLEPCTQFMVGATAPKTSGTFNLLWFNASFIDSAAYMQHFRSLDLSETFLVTSGKLSKKQKLFDLRARGYIFTMPKVYWRLSGSNIQENYTTLYVVDSLLSENAKTIELDIEPRFMSNFRNSNVLAKIPAMEPTDSAIVFTAHYDHLGVHGSDCMFPGANDNGSGTAMLLELGRYFVRNPLNHYNIVLMFFAAEEIGLYGSNYYVENPVFPLKNISALINFDMVGTGSEGISIVNGKENPVIVSEIEHINKKGSFFPDIRVGGFSCSSDHCFFAREGVPAIFIFTRGQENQFYHVPDDTIEALPLTKWLDLKELVTEFAIFRDRK
jgi:hypothetical protein